MKGILIDRSNYEEYVLEYLDDSLTNDSKYAFEEFLEQNPKIKEEINQFEYFKIPKDASVLYEHKEKLIKSESANGILRFSKYLLLLLFALALTLVAYNFNNQEKPAQIKTQVIQNELVEKSSNASAIDQQIENEISKDASIANKGKSIKSDKTLEARKNIIVADKKQIDDQKAKNRIVKSRKSKKEASSTTQAKPIKGTNSKSNITKPNNSNIYASQEVEKINVTKGLSKEESIIANTASINEKIKDKTDLASTSTLDTVKSNYNEVIDHSIVTDVAINVTQKPDKKESLIVPKIELLMPTQIKSKLSYDEYYAIKEDELYDKLSFVYKEPKPSKKRFMGKLIFANISIALLPTYLQKTKI